MPTTTGSTPLTSAETTTVSTTVTTTSEIIFTSQRTEPTSIETTTISLETTPVATSPEATTVAETSASGKPSQATTLAAAGSTALDFAAVKLSRNRSVTPEKLTAVPFIGGEVQCIYLLKKLTFRCIQFKKKSTERRQLHP